MSVQSSDHANPTDRAARPRPANAPPIPPHDLEEQVSTAIELLEAVIADRGLLAYVPAELRARLLIAAGRAARPDPLEKRRLWRVSRRKDKRELRDADQQILDATGIRAARRQNVFATPPPLPAELPPATTPAYDAAGPDAAGHGHVMATTPEHDAAGPDAAGHEHVMAMAPEHGPAAVQIAAVETPRKCYVCKAEFRRLHFFYDSMCAPCAELNWRKRHQRADLSARIALITGARVKIGYQAAIMLLRAGARVVVTTRFPRDAAARYAREDDFSAWRDRLSIYGLDLRHTPSVEALSRHLCGHLPGLDFIINNACQTVRRPPGPPRPWSTTTSSCAPPARCRRVRISCLAAPGRLWRLIHTTIAVPRPRWAPAPAQRRPVSGMPRPCPRLP